MLDFAAKMARNHHEAGPEDVERLRQAGFSDARILYIILWTANFNLANMITDSLGMEYHENFSANLGSLFGAPAAAAAGPGTPGRERGHVPALEGAPLTWINSSPLTWFYARGRVLLVMYGDVMHPNTLAWLERLERWRARHTPSDWLALFVNTGEFPVAKDAATAGPRSRASA